jgi:hypothetical protein
LLSPDNVMLCALRPLAGLLAYGPLPGAELFPYFLGLLVWVGLAVAAVLRAPIVALFRLLRRRRPTESAESGAAFYQESLPPVGGRQ